MKNAMPEYEKLQRQNAKLLTLIAAELKNHENNAKAGTLTWGHCGDLQHSKQLMKELLTFMRNAYDEEKMHAQIEAEIAE